MKHCKPKKQLINKKTEYITKLNLLNDIKISK